MAGSPHGCWMGIAIDVVQDPIAETTCQRRFQRWARLVVVDIEEAPAVVIGTGTSSWLGWQRE